MKRLILALFPLLLLPLTSAKEPVNKDIVALKAFYTQRLNQVLLKDPSLAGYYSLTDAGFSLYASPQQKLRNIPEFSIKWDEIEIVKKAICGDGICEKLNIYQELFSDKAPAPDLSTPQQPLKGLRIAIDPGHVAGDEATARLERKFLDLKKSNNPGLQQDIFLIEGNLNLATSMLLKKKLEALGAEVMLTRKGPNLSAMGVTFEQWKNGMWNQTVNKQFEGGKITAERKKYLLEQISTSDLFHDYFNKQDFEQRTKLVNDFDADLTVIIHYNVDEKNTGWKVTTAKNFTMAFVPGGFHKGSIASKRNRFEFLRLLLSDDLQNSIELSGEVVKEFEKQLGIPAATTADADYLKNYSMFSGTRGVYSRNLMVARLIHSPLVYGEPLYQDNLKEAPALSGVTFSGSNLKAYPARIEKVADCYLQGVLTYVRNQKNKSS